MSAYQFPVSDIRSTQSESRRGQHTMVYTIGKMLEADVQRIGAPRSTVFLAAEFENHQAVMEPMNQMNYGTGFPAVNTEQLNERMMNLDPVEVLEVAAAVPTEAIGASSDATKLQQDDEHNQTDEYLSEDDEAFSAIMHRLNPNVDRTYAQRFNPDESKLFIRLTRPNGDIRNYGYPHPVDWTRSLIKLNKWRNNVFRRNFSHSTYSSSPCRLHQLEIQYLVDAPNICKRDPGSWGYASDRSQTDWTKIQKDFNERFQGKLLPGCPLPRPARTRGVLYGSWKYHTECAISQPNVRKPVNASEN